MRGLFTVLTICLYFTNGIGQYEGEWMPMTNEEAYKRFNIIAPKLNYVHRVDTVSNYNLNAESPEFFMNNVIKLVKPQQVFAQFTGDSSGRPSKKENYYEPSDDNSNLSKCKNGIPECPMIKDTGLENDNDYLKIEVSTVTSVRKAKKLNENKFIIEPVNNLIEDYEMRKKGNSDDKQSTNAEAIKQYETRSYEVIENSEAIDFINSDTRKNINKEGYVYSSPNNKNETKNILAASFLNILGKYNITTKDQLTNYAKSRVSNIQTANPQIIFLPIPIRFQQNHNSINHLRVDPLLAVFLSNYGYYLPSSYGPQNGYKNLYGYLASNNIHNNRPFGPYKLFSDTDSSNK